MRKQDLSASSGIPSPSLYSFLLPKMKTPTITITKLFQKPGQKKNYIGYEADWTAHDIQTFFNVAQTPEVKFAGIGATTRHPYFIIARAGFTYSDFLQKDVYTPDLKHFILDLPKPMEELDHEEKMMAMWYE